MADGADTDMKDAEDTTATRPKKVARHRLSKEAQLDASEVGGSILEESKIPSVDSGPVHQTSETAGKMADASIGAADKPDEENADVDMTEPSQDLNPSGMKDQVVPMEGVGLVTGELKDTKAATASLKMDAQSLVVTKKENPKDEIVILSDDESVPVVNKRNVNCINPDCKSLEHIQLLAAPSYVDAYFGQTWRRRFKGSRAPPQVCEICYELATIVHEEMAAALRNDTSIFDVEFSKPNETVILSDSDTDDDELEYENEYLSLSVVDFVQTNLKDVINECIGKYNLDSQLQRVEDSVAESVESLTLTCKETLALQNDTQIKLDKLRSDLYASFGPKPRSLIPVEIIDLAGPTVDVDEELPPLDPLAVSKPSGVAMKRVTQGARSSNTKRQATVSPLDQNVSSVHSPIILSMEGNSEVVALEQVKVIHRQLPPMGPLSRPKPKIGDDVYAMRFSLFSVWAKSTIIDVSVKYSGSQMPEVDHTAYKVRFEGKKFQTKLLTGRQLAYIYPPKVRLLVGTRVIAVFKDAEVPGESYYAGIVAEPPKQLNNYRYLIFFDDGYTQYVMHDRLRLVCEASRHPADDVHEDSKAFIKKYMMMYPERPMVKVGVGQVIKTEWNGKWWLARVIETDCSLCNMNFLADARTEWLYRGSTRLAPLYKELARSNPNTEPQTSATRHRNAGIATLKKANMPYVEYTLAAEAEPETETETENEPETETVKIDEIVEKPSRAVAKKSTTKRPVLMQTSAPRTRQQYIPTEGRIKFDIYNLGDYAAPLKFVPHQCGPPCVNRVPYYPDLMKHCGPLAVPLLLGWRREIVKYRGKKVALYKAPCGRRLRKMDELARYLRFTKCSIGLDYFDCNFWVNCLNEFMTSRHIGFIKDLSYEIEYMPVQCANSVDHLLPDYVAYTTKREPVESVKLNLDPEFLTGCDCKDGCQDRDKCACWQLTFAGTIFTSGKTGVPDNSIGYRYKRLPEPVLTGIYECNSRCQCSSTCSNRVVQNPLRSKLQVFRTMNRGWGIRALNDMPQGSFICIYAGRLLNEHEANEGGKNYGDEYLAELDYIEVVERLKEGYEAQVEDIFGPQCEEDSMTDMDSNESESKPLKKTEVEFRDSDEDFKPAAAQDEDVDMEADTSGIKTRSFRNKKKSKRHGKKDGKGLSVDEDTGSKDSECVTVSDDEELSKRRPQRFAPAALPDPMDLEDERPLSFPSIRTYFGETDMCYIMDAKTSGNIGRYLNHSCNPNVFVQNVFVDTHDLRFPWVAFFALSYIQAGTELTWDYNYDIGSVKDKVLYCKCGSADCRGRLL